jgi:hypothetical protein
VTLHALDMDFKELKNTKLIKFIVEIINLGANFAGIK